jgi:molecular chaperone DnaK
MAKKHLSQDNRATVDLPYLQQTPNGPFNFHYELTREQYERLTQDLVQRSIRIVDEILHRAGLSGGQIDEIIMAGGQSRSPFIHRFITERFNKRPNMRVHPDHAVAIGAAVVADAAQGEADVSLIDILPASLRILKEGSLEVLLERGTKLPARTRFRMEATTEDDPEFNCTLYRGESPTPDGNELLGTVRLPSTLTEAVSGAEAEVVLDVSADGLLTLAMRHPETKQIQYLQIALSQDGKATDDVEEDYDVDIEIVAD